MKIELVCRCGDTIQIIEIPTETCINTPDACVRIDPIDFWHCCDTRHFISEGVMG